ncbi:hypothetical protein LTR91_015783 [Friedmanniomyces endolithicus]|uniref:adenosine deaminase n=1 Tax=Friedmanniomyces endolithicus TaxID=329885 RepID=A0AAN6K948_9PEZI|nr:hypothetical protein LTS02_003594 [Friedmanniomyces endolithicus]KAK0868849.1 hypothetical protein LTR87_013973 [Friedmanniomyces endolithicus]KAK0929448.1 hypothetical protein LTR57_001928 [Friedmanniomyces endolithicus]KAK0961278.1 hypothetical protein LTS01_020452 [Friedmanniomyces endolithicus]KAK0970780.1 hypothetical protein LTR91_015783 [Friedmanniomyces endolithicus]
MSSPEETKELLAKSIRTAESSHEYRQGRGKLLAAEKEGVWYASARAQASPSEPRTQEIVLRIRESERIDLTLYGNLPSEAVPDPNTRDMGGRFLANKSRIAESRMFKIAQRMPKGCHLHIHFNSELPPEELFPHARSSTVLQTMHVRTTKPLSSRENFALAEVVLSVLPKDTKKSDCFAPEYNPDAKDPNNSPWMLWADFRKAFPADVECEETPEGLDKAECWAREKMVVTRRNTYNDVQTHNGAWACFNQGTRAFKGLVNYESVYRWYIGSAIDSMVSDRVMYAELRPMLMDKSIPSDDGTRKLDLKDQMTIICEEVQKKRDAMEKQGELDRFPFGLKIIYCTPRSIPKPKMQSELNDCIQLKLQFPDLICGFDLVGAEDRPNSIGFYADLLVGFAETCKSLKINIPFMFHAGESLLDTGGSFNPDNSNLYDALLLNCKRIGHGYALLKHPLLVERYKKQNICLELCPISNELLHLCGNIREHPFPALLAAGLHCTLNADNPGLYRGATHDSSSLSYEFYQVMVGDTRMTIHGWKQLAQWSIEHSCLSAADKKRGLEIFQKDWEEFCVWVDDTYGEYADNLTSPVLPNLS